MTWWHFITSLGGLSVTAPAALAIAAWLAAGRCWRLSLFWCAVFGAGMVLVVATKVAFLGWGVGPEWLDFTGFSGHATRAAAVYPVACFVLLQDCSRRVCAAGVVLGVLFAALLSASRVVVHAHSLSESLLGFSLGLLMAAALMWRAQRSAHMVLRPVLIGLSLVVLVLSSRTEPSFAQTDGVIATLAMALSGHDRVYVRRGWKMAPRPGAPGCAIGAAKPGGACAWPNSMHKMV